MAGKYLFGMQTGLVYPLFYLGINSGVFWRFRVISRNTGRNYGLGRNEIQVKNSKKARQIVGKNEKSKSHGEVEKYKRKKEEEEVRSKKKKSRKKNQEKLTVIRFMHASS